MLKGRGVTLLKNNTLLERYWPIRIQYTMADNRLQRAIPRKALTLSRAILLNVMVLLPKLRENMQSVSTVTVFLSFELVTDNSLLPVS